MSPARMCFLDGKRPCDLTCKSAFEVDDPVDNIDCYFIWLAHHFGEALFETRRILEGMGNPSAGPEGSAGSSGAPPPKGPKGGGFPTN
ncbi:MAG: hypothetical protein AB1726_10535 [Planctomycetota bacterium]